MEERKITEVESLEIISQMITRTRQRYIGDGNIMLMWGYLTVTVSALVWILLAVTRNPVCNWLFFLIWIIGGTLTPIMARKRQKVTGVKSHLDVITSQVWSVVGFSAIAATLFCLVLMLFWGKNCWAMELAFALMLVPFGEIVQGIVIREKSLVVGGSVGLLAGIFTTCCLAGQIPLCLNWYMPLFIVAFTAMMIIPGHILNNKAKKE